MSSRLGRFIVIAGFFLLVFGLSSTYKLAWAADPAMTSPTPGSILTTADVTFNWSAGVVDQYWLGVGTSQASIESPPLGDIYTHSTGTNTSQAVSGIPIDGNTLYVRLWWYINSTWDYADYTYQTQTTTANGTTVGDINRPPVLDPLSDITVSEGATITLSPTATDPDGDTLTYTYSDWMSSASYTTNHDDAGTHAVTVTVSDGTLTDSQVVTVIVLNGNRPPVLDPLSDIMVNEGVNVTLNPTATDLDGDTLTFTYSGWMSSNNYTTSYIDAGVHTVIVTVSDGLLTDSQAVTITVIESPLQITFKWDPNTEDDLAGYKIYYSNTSGIYDSNEDVGNQTSYTIFGIESDKTYYFAVAAYDSSGNESAYSDEVDYTY